jgi:hypothetical protein
VCIGCATGNPYADPGRAPNPFGTSFKTREEVLAQIPAGTGVETAQAIMRARGFEPSSSERGESGLRLVFHRFDPGRLRTSTQDTWITIEFKRGVLVDVDVH